MLENIEKNLKDLGTMEDIQCVVLFRKDGTILHSILPHTLERRNFELLRWMKHTVTHTASEFNRGKVQTILYELKDANVLFVSGKRGILASTTVEEANTALVKLEMKTISSKIEKQMKIK